ncbi:MAG: dicarboxylate/amino acid:cation symporter [Chthoniobacterales bacterium]|nr:dicarboxylate/amino acid:cation symporter [Chthoniobacterales bacterium]
MGAGPKLSDAARILVALVVGAIVGAVAPSGAGIGTLTVGGVLGFIGDIFLRLLQMVVVPLVATSIITSVAGLGRDHAFGRLGLKTLAYFATTTLLACLLALLIFNAVQPGRVDSEVSSRLLAAVPGNADSIREGLSDHSAGDLADVVLRVVPVNVFGAATQNREMLAVIFFALLFGFFTGRLPDGRREAFQSFWESANDVMMAITHAVMRVAPFGIFALMAQTVQAGGAAAIKPLLLFFICVAGGLAVHMFGVLAALMRVFGGFSPWQHYRAMLPALLTAFSTASSSATLPVTLECLEKNARISPRVAGFVAPLGATVNMDGTALYECAVVLFIAQLYGVSLDWTQQALVALLALLTSVGVAGIPAASLVAIVIILQAVGLPLEAVAIVMATDRMLDMMRTAVNVFGDTCGAAIIARSEGEKVYPRVSA